MLKKWEAAAREAVRSVLKREYLPALLGLPAESRAQLRQDRELRRYKRVCKASFDRWFARLPRPLELSKDVEASIHPVRGCACALRAWRLAMLVVCFLGGCRCRRVYELSENAKLLRVCVQVVRLAEAFGQRDPHGQLPVHFGHCGNADKVDFYCRAFKEHVIKHGSLFVEDFDD
jgi:hypothetical protein